ncbi:seven-hairpin glycosidase [Serendipita vermifera]|nr:seven-hairpin glycosidase [Serendipita vermifera]
MQARPPAWVLVKDAFGRYKRLSVTKKLLLFIVIASCTLAVLRHQSYGPHMPGPPPGIFSPFKHHAPVRPVKDPKVWEQRGEAVREAFLHAYGGYEKYAFGFDELKPLNNDTLTNLNGWGLTIVDGLDTMILMGLDAEVEDAMEHVRNMNFTVHNNFINFFETTIRYVGGLLGAYYLCTISDKRTYRKKHAPLLLEKVDHLSRIMMGGFETESGLPVGGLRFRKGELDLNYPSSSTRLAEMASCQMEFKYLSHLTHESTYFFKSDRVMEIMEREQGKTMTRGTVTLENGKTEERMVPGHDSGLWTTQFHLEDGKMYGTQISAGAMGDSAYEYLLKQYLLSGRTETRLLDMYMKAMDGIIEHLLYLSPDRNLLYVTDLGTWGTPSGNMEHLSCYLPGVFALGAKLLDPDYPWPDNSSSRIRARAPTPSKSLKAKLDLHMRIAKGLAYTCWVMYNDMPSGIGPETVHFQYGTVPKGTLTRDNYNHLRWAPKLEAWERGGRDGPLIGTEDWLPSLASDTQEWIIRDARYMLRPEAVEAMYLLWRTTGDPIWRERGWRMFEAINAHTRTPKAYASVRFVDLSEPLWMNEMPSFFLAETLKYVYLLTHDKELLPLDQMVFNTEAHPFPMFKWTPEELSKYNIRR